MKNGFYYVYILRSTKNPGKHYTGFTENPQSRLEHHNAGQCPHSSKYRPWRFETCIAFEDRQKALAFESYLKTHSGRAFAKKHF